jgi:hypothetical protein
MCEASAPAYCPSHAVGHDQQALVGIGSLVILILEAYVAGCHAHIDPFVPNKADPITTDLPEYVKQEFYTYLHCESLTYGFFRLACAPCK